MEKKKKEWSSFDYSMVKNIPEVRIRLQLLQERLKNLPDKDTLKVLNVGIGSGDIELMLLTQFKNVTSVDSNQANYTLLTKRLKQNGLPDATFIHGKIEEASFSEVYDHIVLFGILEHLKDPVTVLKKLTKIITPRGKMYIVVNLAHSLHRLLGVKMGMISDVEQLSDSDIKLGHYRVYTLPLLKKHVEAAGLSICFQELFYLKPLPTSLLTPLPMKIHEGLYELGKEVSEFASYVYLEVET